MATVKDFVRETLEQVTEAVVEFGDGTKYGATANPFVGIPTKDGAQLGIISEYGGQPTVIVNFDLAVTIEESGKVEGGAGLKIATLVELGGKGSEESTSKSVSRVQFALPLRLGDTEEHKENRKPVRLNY